MSILTPEVVNYGHSIVETVTLMIIKRLLVSLYIYYGDPLDKPIMIFDNDRLCMDASGNYYEQFHDVLIITYGTITINSGKKMFLDFSYEMYLGINC